MPIPLPATAPADLALFPPLTVEQVDASRTSSWYELFEDITVPATIIDLRELCEEAAFLEWLEADSIFLPQHSEGALDPTDEADRADDSPLTPGLTSGRPSRSRSTSSASSSSISSSSSSSSSDEVAPVYHLPKLNAAIRSALRRFGGAVFPKLNWTSPKDAACLLPQTAAGALHCTSPADVYLLLKSSDFISFDLDPTRAYEGTNPNTPESDRSRESEGRGTGTGRLELVLKKFEDINPSREVRCFVRNRMLIGMTQRDTNYYDHLQSPETREKVCNTVRAFWEDEIRENYAGGDDYVFDLYLSANLLDAKIIDFQPYRLSTDPLLYTYEDLLTILETALSTQASPLTETEEQGEIQQGRLPIFRVVDSPSHPSASRNAPAYQSSMMPLEMIEMSQGRSMVEFKEAWEEAVAAGMAD